MTRRLVFQRPVERHVRKDVPGKGRYHDKSVGWYLRNTEKRWIKGTHVVDTELVRVTKWTSGHEEVLPLKPYPVGPKKRKYLKVSMGHQIVVFFHRVVGFVYGKKTKKARRIAVTDGPREQATSAAAGAWTGAAAGGVSDASDAGGVSDAAPQGAAQLSVGYFNWLQLGCQVDFPRCSG